MKTIDLSRLKEKVRLAVQQANFEIDPDLRLAVENALPGEKAAAGREICRQILANADIAREEQLALCQDTGLALFFVTMGEEVKTEKNGFAGIADAIRQGTIEGYQEGYLRKSVCDPLTRENTKDNTPVFIHWELVPGDVFEVVFMAKGGGAENMSALKMMTPAAGLAGIEDFVLATVEKAGPNPCPPTVIGVGIGGNFDQSALLAKKALLRKPLGSHHPEPFYADLEKRLLEKINRTGIGPMGLGGTWTSLAVHVEKAPCHIASLPVAVNVNCHSHRVLVLDI